MSNPSLTARRAILPLLAIILATYVVTLKSGVHWGDDFAYYLHHAQNLIAGRPYAETGLIENPAVRNLSPRYYPPGFPILIAPALEIFGFDYTAMKVEIALLFVVGLWFMYVLFHDRLTDWQAVVVVVLIGLNPVLWELRNEVISDLPFLTATYGSLALIQWLSARYAGDPPAVWGVATGISIYLAYSVRQPGLMLIPALLCFDLMRAHRVRLFSILATVTAGVAMGAQRLVLGSDGRSALFDFSPHWLISSLVGNLRGSDEFWHNAWSPAASKVVFLGALALIALGLWAALRSGIRIYDLFGLFYILLIVPYPYLSVRYLIPIVPLLMLYLVLGTAFVTRRFSRKIAMASTACVLAMILASYGSNYAAASSSPIREGVSDPQFVALCEYVRANTALDSRFVVRKPRVFTLLTDRAAATYSPSQQPAELLKFMGSIHATYLAWGDPPAVDFDTDLVILQRFIDDYGSRLTLIYQNPHYRLYRLA